MRSFDFTQLGGFPLDEDALDYLQTGWKELFDAFSKLGLPGTPAVNTPLIITGCQFNAAGASISNGWFWYNGECIPLTGGTFSISNIGQLRVTITTATTNMTYFDTTTHPSKIIKSAAINDTGSAYSTVDASHFPFKNMLPFVKENAFTSASVSSAGGEITATINYKKNLLNNTLHIQGDVTMHSSLLTITPAAYILANLAAGYYPALATCKFKAQVPLTGGSTFYYDTFTPAAPIKDLQMELDPAGELKVTAFRNSAGVDYTASFNIILPLD